MGLYDRARVGGPCYDPLDLVPSRSLLVEDISGRHRRGLIAIPHANELIGLLAPSRR